MYTHLYTLDVLSFHKHGIMFKAKFKLYSNIIVRKNVK